MYSKGVATPSFRYVGLTEAWRRFSRDDDLWSVKCGLTSRKYTTHFLLLPLKVHTFPVWLFDLIPIVSNEPMSVSHAAERPVSLVCHDAGWHLCDDNDNLRDIRDPGVLVPQLPRCLLFTRADADQWPGPILWLLLPPLIGHNILIGFITLYGTISFIL